MRADMLLSLHDQEIEGIRFIEKIGDGGMGEVWAAHDETLDIPIAVKVLKPELADNQRFVTRFTLEARAVARLNHQSIVRIYRTARLRYLSSPLRVLIMERIAGQDLASISDQADGKGINPEVALSIAAQIARGLHYSHQHGVIHCDIKPANIVFDAESGNAKLLDFGIAGFTDDSMAKALPPVLAGTPAFMAPEQVLGLKLSPKTDVYGLGMTLFQLLCGDAPFHEGSSDTIMDAQLHDEIPLDLLSESGLDDASLNLIQAMCTKRAEQRPTMLEVIAQLESILGESAPTMMTTRVPQLRVGSNIRRPDSRFFGRKDDLARIAEALEVEGNNLLSLVGSGGVGKTRLSQEYGISALEHFDGGVAFADLTQAADAEDIGRLVATALSLPDARGPILAHVHDSLRFRAGRTLVILDNFEHLTKHADKTLGLWMQNTPMVHFLATTRESLHIPGEVRELLQPLPTSGDNPPAMALFLDRARLENPRFDPDAAELETIGEIVEGLEGVPLAIELAAARVRSISPAQILERLPEKLDLLRSRNPDLPARQATLRGAIEWSWDLLEDWEKSALAQVSLFRGGFFLEAAEALLDLSAFEDAPFGVDAVESLLDRSLLHIDVFPELRGEFRYRLLESLREFAAEKFDEFVADGALSRELLERRHAEYFADSAEALIGEKFHPCTLEAALRIKVEADNARLGIENFLQSEPQLAGRLLTSHRAAFSANAIEGAIFGQVMGLLDLPKSEISTHLRILLSAYAIQMMINGGQAEQAAACGDAALLCAQEDYDAEASSSHRRTLTLANELRAVAEMISADYKLSKEYFVKAESLIADDAEDGIKTRISRAAAHTLMELGEFDEAEKKFLTAARIARAEGDDYELISVYQRLPSLLLHMGRYDDAETACLEFEEISKRVDSTKSLADSYFVRANLAYARQRYHDAIDLFTKAEVAFRKAGGVRNALVAIGNRATNYSNIGEDELALKSHLEARAVWEELGNEAMIASRNLGIGTALGNLKRYEEGLEALRTALESVERLGIKPLIAGAKGFISSNLLQDPSRHGDRTMMEEARDIGREAAELHKAMGAQNTRLCFDSVTNQAFAHLLLSRITDDTEEAKSELAQALECAEEGAKIGEAASIVKEEQIGEKSIAVAGWERIQAVRTAAAGFDIR